MNATVRILDGLEELAPPNGSSMSQETYRSRQLMSWPLRFETFVFDDEEFPQLCSSCLTELKEIIGPHTLTVAFYDSNYNKVTLAESPGRYGAVVEITPESGRVTRRFRTLFRSPQTFSWAREHVPFSMEFPPQFGFNASAVEAQKELINNYLKSLWIQSLRHDSGSAALLASLYETSNEEQTRSDSGNDAWSLDRQWWVASKRKIYNQDEAQPFISPRMVEEVAPILREGSLAEAGIKSAADERIDALCQEWARNSDQGFSVCLARRSVIWFHRAYGMRLGVPMTTTTRSWMASISKLLAGSLLMMLVDENRLSLDEPISSYLPSWRGVETSPPLTLRHLMTHTAGLWGHLGDEIHDFEELVADYAAHLVIGQRYEYNGASFALAGKVIETVTGEEISQCFQHHLLQPLQATNTQITTMAWNTHGTARDIAALGQMLLNKGTYGQWRFFGEDTFQQLLPQRLTQVLGPDAGEEYGIGSSWFRDEGLGENTFGHGAASASTLRIDPHNELVVMMARNNAGANFETYHPQFVKLVADSVQH
jgi:CubicO group peptidase (beta-lactamase class C family)